MSLIDNLGTNNRPHYKLKTSYGWYRCNKCRRFLPRSQFHKRMAVPCRLSSSCKECEHDRYTQRASRSVTLAPQPTLLKSLADSACP